LKCSRREKKTRAPSQTREIKEGGTGKGGEESRRDAERGGDNTLFERGGIFLKGRLGDNLWLIHSERGRVEKLDRIDQKVEGGVRSDVACCERKGLHIMPNLHRRGLRFQEQRTVNPRCGSTRLETRFVTNENTESLPAVTKGGGSSEREGTNLTDSHMVRQDPESYLKKSDG